MLLLLLVKNFTRDKAEAGRPEGVKAMSISGSEQSIFLLFQSNQIDSPWQYVGTFPMPTSSKLRNPNLQELISEQRINSN